MIDELKEEEIVNKVGGRFKLSTLIQKRMIALNQGARALVESRGVDRMTIVIQEIMQEKIYLDMSGKLKTVEPTEELEVRPRHNDVVVDRFRRVLDHRPL
jgi:DNA-directed RNA polymerase subunit omega